MGLVPSLDGCNNWAATAVTALFGRAGLQHSLLRGLATTVVSMLVGSAGSPIISGSGVILEGFQFWLGLPAGCGRVVVALWRCHS